MHTSQHIAEMLATRLCHDLTGPIGAVSNGVELLEDGGTSMFEDASELIASSASEAISRLQFYRQAYGRTNADNYVTLSNMRDLMESFFGHTKVQIKWINETSLDMSVPAYKAKLLLNSMIIVASVLIRGGEVTIDVSQNAATITLKAMGESIKLDDEVLDELQDKTPDNQLTPKTVQPHLARLFARQCNMEITFDLQPGYFLLVLQNI